MLNDIQNLRFIIWTACTQIQNSLFSFNIAISSTPKETDGLTMIATRLVKIQRKKTTYDTILPMRHVQKMPIDTIVR